MISDEYLQFPSSIVYLVDQKGKRYVTPFPKDIIQPAQYGLGVKVGAVYMSQYLLIPYNRIEDHFMDQMGFPVSAGVIWK